MSLPTDLEIKDYLRISTDVEDILIFGLNQTAQAVVSRYLAMPLDTRARTFAGRYPRQGVRREPAEQLVIPQAPCSTTAVVTDVDDVTVDAATYTIDPRRGLVNAVRDTVFDHPPYTIAADVGLPWDPDYETDVDPVLRQAVFDLASDMWSRRNPATLHVSSGGSVSSTYTAADIPSRTKMLLETLRPKARAW